MSVLTVLLAVAIIAFVIGQQLIGTALQGKRVVVLPAVLTVIGIVDISHSHARVTATDIVLLGASAALAIGVGLSLGAITHLERRNGYLWAQLPKSGLILWAGLIASRLVIAVIAHAAGATLAASTDSILLVLGLNRAGQALVVVPRAIAAGIPFAPEKDGSVFGGGWFAGHER